ncbi:hypothetical protein C8J57DRAFT_164928 [Mycena rebaudengoi]|nr:hypothetical protein C8J57DRAFT_164928 [Mycena rebaudengoi]
MLRPIADGASLRQDPRLSLSIYYYMLPQFGSLAPLVAVTKYADYPCQARFDFTFLRTGSSSSSASSPRQTPSLKGPGHLHRIMTALVSILTTVGLGTYVGCVGIMFMHPQAIFMNRNHTFSILVDLAKGLGAAADIATLAMCMFLYVPQVC